MREKRLASWLTLREMARRLALSPAYVSDLELGRRRWTPKILARYQRALP
jgi:transcriptional regulator with XRE-family HTH domain